MSVKDFLSREATFYRVHLTVFIFVPLVFSVILYLCNGRFHIPFIDSLFLCYSAMTVTGLSTVNLSSMTAWQQVILYLLMACGDITIVSWVMVLVRMEYFKSKCEYVVSKHKSIFKDRATFLAAISSPIAAFRPPNILSPRTETAPTLLTSPMPDSLADEKLLDVKNLSSSPSNDSVPLPDEPSPSREEEDPPQRIAFSTALSVDTAEPTRQRPNDGIPVRRTTTVRTTATARTRLTLPPEQTSTPLNPLSLIQRLLNYISPKAYARLERKLTLPLSTIEQGKDKPWLSFDLHVGRNSDFKTDSLTDEQLEEVGGTEFKALRVLSFIIPIYFIGSHLFTFVLFAPWLSVTKTYDGVFENQERLVKKPWFSLFQVMGAYTGGGLSLADEGMIPFQNAYLMIFALMFAILAGNHALPIFLRLIIWTAYKVTSRKGNGETHKALSFLLDHPRRCFIYLFPSHQTWFLVFCLLSFSVIEWVGFEVLNIGLPIYTSLSTAPRIIDGLFQGLAARASGFSIVPIAEAAPALQFLYVVMMYIAVYPVAFSIRTTNVYEERSLGIFEVPPDQEDEEPEDLNTLEPRQRIGRYLSWHLRRQLANDIWWLISSIFLIAIIERGNLLDESKKWFDLFHVIFELVSAFGGIGLSLGVPYDNFSFSGALKPLSKIVIIIIMIRGRHRGLPVAIDRAILLPSELKLGKTMRNAGISRPVDPQISSMP